MILANQPRSGLNVSNATCHIYWLDVQTYNHRCGPSTML